VTVKKYEYKNSIDFNRKRGNYMNNTARVFPRKTKASPDDALAFFGAPPRDIPEITEQEWRGLQREWVRPALVASKFRTEVAV
jgi:hypothetical protein